MGAKDSRPESAFAVEQERATGSPETAISSLHAGIGIAAVRQGLGDQLRHKSRLQPRAVPEWIGRGRIVLGHKLNPQGGLAFAAIGFQIRPFLAQIAGRA